MDHASCRGTLLINPHLQAKKAIDNNRIWVLQYLHDEKGWMPDDEIFELAIDAADH